MKTVLSAICVRQDDGELEQVELGSYPLGGEAQKRGGAGRRRRRL